jgi:hypothetical protein
MALPISSSLISAQAQAYAAPKNGRPNVAPQVEKLAARGSDNAVRVEISAEARKADQSRLESRTSEARADRQADAERAAEADKAADDRKADETRRTARDFAREAPLRGFEARDAQENAGTRNTRPGTTLDIRI